MLLARLVDGRLWRINSLSLVVLVCGGELPPELPVPSDVDIVALPADHPAAPVRFAAACSAIIGIDWMPDDPVPMTPTRKVMKADLVQQYLAANPGHQQV